MQLELWSDLICPWCWLGHARLHEAVRGLGIAGDVELRWRSFQLDPHAAAEPTDIGSAVDAKYGPGAFDAMSARLTRLGAEAGLEFRFDRALRVNTADAHRLVLEVQHRHPRQVDALVGRLFAAHFRDGADLSAADALADLAAEAGIERDEAREILASDAGAADLAGDRAEALEAGVTGVPAVAFRGATVIPGAQDVDTMALVLARLHARVG